MESNFSSGTGNLEVLDSGLELANRTSAFYTVGGGTGNYGITQEKPKKRLGYQAAKRLFDIVFSAAAMIVLWPVFLVTAAAIKVEDGGAVIHRRYCVGKNGKEFPMYKFRSMVENADELIDSFPEEMKKQYLQGIKLVNDYRITRTGRFIRKTSIDELPQLLNVLKGDMSFVGPRPVIEREVKAYDAQAGVLLSVRPGITGTWQVFGRGDVAYLSPESRNLQLSYVENMGFLYDARILFMTLGKVIRGEGAR